jgi:hypothetical protein
MNEQELREQIAKEIVVDLEITLENCACLGRDAYGSYIEKCKQSILNKIRNQ